MNPIVKKFNNLIQKTIFKPKNKTTILKSQFKINDKFIISSFNKYFITFIGLLFLYLFYLLIPILYDKGWVQNKIESKFIDEFKINLSSSADISYRILPSPHYFIKNSKILIDNAESQKPIADIKNLKVFLSQGNFFNKEKITIKKVIINNANFSLLSNDLKILNEFSNNQFSNKKIKINDSNIFLKNNLNETITIVKIDEAIFFYNSEKLVNLFNLKGKTFNVPFFFDLTNKISLQKKKQIDINAKSLKLSIKNEIIKENNSSIGKNILSFLNSTIRTNYNIRDKLITFNSYKSKINTSEIYYNGELSVNPFDLNLNIDLNNFKVSKIFDFNLILIEFLKSKLLFNENLSLNAFIDINSNIEEIFHNADIYFNINNGKINFDKTVFINKNIGLVKLENSNLFIEDYKLILSTDLLIDIKNFDRLYSFLNTNKKSRKDIKNILINLNYDFSDNTINFNNIKIDNKEVNDQFLTIIDGFNDNDTNNLIKSRRLINDLLNIYEG